MHTERASYHRNEPPLNIVVNMEGVQLGRALGVPHFVNNTLRELRQISTMHMSCQVSRADLGGAQIASLCTNTYTLEPTIPGWMHLLPRRLQKVQSAYRHWYRATQQHILLPSLLQDYHLELAPHHFQPAVSTLPRVVICYDLHIFDIPWRYTPDQHKRLSVQFRNNMQSAHAILLPFIRPFQALPTLLPETQQKIFFVPSPPLLSDIPLEEAAVHAMRERFLPDRQRKLLLYPALLQKHKNHTTLLSCLALLRQQGHNVFLVCPGSEADPATTTQLHQHAEAVGIADYVAFPGFVRSEELRALYELCHAAISPSFAEGGNMIVQEAVWFERPVACSNIESAQEQVHLMGANVPMFDPNNADEMARAVVQLLEHGAAFVTSNQPARQHMQQWTWAVMARRFCEVFSWVAQRGGDATKPDPTPY